MGNSNETGKVIGALLVGALLGAAAGVLFAPDKGGKTRSKLVDGATDFADNVKSRISDEISGLRHKVDGMLGTAENEAKQAVKSGYKG